MKIGILTFHSQLNYGGVLQAFALQEVLRGLGHDVQIIDRWMDPDNRSLEQGYNHLGVKGWASVILRSLLGGWEWKKFRRVQATKRFLRTYLHLAPYHFVNWTDLVSSTSTPNFNSLPSPSTLDFDYIIVGSDQIWHTGDYSDPSVYLLEECPFFSSPSTLNFNSRRPSTSTPNFNSSHAISYAASFGMTSIPPECEAQYRAGFSRFAKISCRESEGVALCRQLGFVATHVVDPTLLLDPAVWHRLVKPSPTHTKPKIVCYLMDGNVPKHMEVLESYARANDVDIDIFLDGRFCVTLPKSVRQLRERLREWKIRRRIEAGPFEFVQAIADADFVLTDSFHALMFSCIFNKNVRFLRPENAMRRKMFSRIEEFSTACIAGQVVCDSVGDALSSLEKGERVSYRMESIDQRRNASLKWLKEALAS